MQQDEPLYSLDDVSFKCSPNRDIDEKIPDILVTDRLCTECFNEVLFIYTNDMNIVERERKNIENTCRFRDWHAEIEE